MVGGPWTAMMITRGVGAWTAGGRPSKMWRPALPPARPPHPIPGREVGVRRVLVVEEGGRIAALLRAQLSERAWAVEAAEDAVAAMGSLRDKDFDLVVIDLRLPDEGALEVVRVLHANDVMASVL